ncbi:MAG TPA: carboxymuconolactone decarboxylase family protein [Candidatus Anoxymicrobiaceae bacterium]
MAKQSRKHEDVIKGLSVQDGGIIESLLAIQLDNIEQSGLDPKTHALVRIAALISVDAAPASFMWQIGVALESGVTPEDIVGVVVALAPTVGMAKIVATAPEIALALGIDLEDIMA